MDEIYFNLETTLNKWINELINEWMNQSKTVIDIDVVSQLFSLSYTWTLHIYHS